MPQVLTEFAMIQCAHGTLAQNNPTSDKWSINGGRVMLENDTGTFPSCIFPYPCVSYTLRSMGLNATTVDGRKVILVTDFNQSITGLPIIMTESHNVFDDSIPAPIPAGRPTPGLAPELTDIVRPILTVSPPMGAFSLSSSTPPVLTVNFTLAAQNPLKWILTLINEPLASDIDVTAVQPPGLTVTPAGGGWTDPFLAVTVTMDASFMTALTLGKHHLYITGVSKRGLSGVAEFVLQVGP